MTEATRAILTERVEQLDRRTASLERDHDALIGELERLNEALEIVAGERQAIALDLAFDEATSRLFQTLGDGYTVEDALLSSDEISGTSSSPIVNIFCGPGS